MVLLYNLLFFFGKSSFDFSFFLAKSGILMLGQTLRFLESGLSKFVHGWGTFITSSLQGRNSKLRETVAFY